MSYLPRYVRFLRKHASTRKPLTVVFDASNGTTGMVVRELFKNHQHIKNTIINGRPDGRFPAHGPDPWKPGATKQLAAAIKKRKADCGVIFDADGDRVFFLDNDGAMLSSDEAAIILSQSIKTSVLLDIRMGFHIHETLKKRHVDIVHSRVGHTFIKRLMKKKNIAFGAELSGHYYFKKFFYADSGVLAAVQFLNNLSRMKISLSEWRASLPNYFHSGEKNFRISNKKTVLLRIDRHYKKRAKKISRVDGIRMDFENDTGRFWFSVRASNTEDLLRLNLEADNKKLLTEELQALTHIIRSKK